MSLVSSLGLVLFLIATITGFTLLMQSNRVWEALCESVGVYNERCVILFGDSLMAQFSMASNFGWTPYKNRSVSGRRAVTALADLIKVLPEATDVVFLLGTNDLGTDVSPEELVFAMARIGRAAQAFGCGVWFAASCSFRGASRHSLSGSIGVRKWNVTTNVRAERI